MPRETTSFTKNRERCRTCALFGDEFREGTREKANQVEKGCKSGKEAENMDDEDRYAWRKYCGAGYKYNVYPENYETPEEYEADLAHAIRERGDEGKFAPKSKNAAKNAGNKK